MNKKKPLIAISMGDPAGIGPEIIVKALPSIRRICVPAIICYKDVICNTARKIGLGVDNAVLIDVGDLKRKNIAFGKITADGGKAAFDCIDTAAKLVMQGYAEALVTAPISKEALKSARVRFPGHTELLASLSGTKDFAMMLAGGPLKVVLATIHEPLKKVNALLEKKEILKKIILTAKWLKEKEGIKKPRIAVAALNPHAGESGIFGDEEKKIIAPAIKKASNILRIKIDGPVVPDTLFYKAYNGRYDAVVCMYHDQGLIPLKMIAFDTGVNITLGLPFVRTSPDHGTAYDIAGKGVASPKSFIEAVKAAVKYLKH